MAVSSYGFRGQAWPGLLQHCYDLDQSIILGRLVCDVIHTFQFDADGKIVTVLAPVESRTAGVPGALVEGNELDHAPLPVNQQVRRDLQALQLRKTGMRVVIQRVAEQLFNARRAELSRRQADAVNNEQLYLNPLRTIVTVR